MEPSNEYVLDFKGLFGRNERVTLSASSLLEAGTETKRLLEGKLLSSAILERKVGNGHWSWDFDNKKWLPMEAGI